MDVNPFNAETVRVHDAESRIPVLSHDFAGIEKNGFAGPVKQNRYYRSFTKGYL
jgi:hypothetical protein